ncbi:MAG: biotin--[acetyl-CoA-carboxylase] ligase [Dehalococcoidia bacterium]|nr:biotin--[acetyl-CoA-carboxylase] ligase [Dehalococcoidia bacterium]
MHSINVARIQTALSNSVVGHRIHYHRVLGSTMDTARDLAHDGEREGAVVIAEEQNKGRGRFNRVWVSPPGLNLYFTVLLRPEPGQLPYMNMAAALAVFDTVAQVPGLKPAVKWPNDVRIGGRKLSGILVETEFEGDRLAHALVGIGVNVNLDVSEHPEIADTATSLRSEAGREFDRSEALHSVLKNLDTWYARVRSGESLTEDWAATLETLGKRVELRWRDQVLTGLAESVDDQGNLTLLQPGGKRVTVVAGEVTSQV